MVANGGPSSMRYITIPLGCSAWGEERESTPMDYTQYLIIVDIILRLRQALFA